MTVSLAADVAAKRELLIEMMLATVDRTLPTPEPAVRQFVVGFANVLQASSAGDHGARDLYLTSVIPALRLGGPFALDTVLACMLRVTAAVACVLGPAHVRWVADYCADYTARLLDLWHGRT
jgi:hypothetical protein